MLAKPPACRGCPMYGDGVGFVPDEVPAGARVVFVAQNPGDTEEAQARPLVGPTGQVWRRRFVARHIPGVVVGYANVIKCRMMGALGQPKTNDMPKLGSDVWRDALACCRPFLDETLAKAAPDAWVVPMGAYACAALMPELHGPILHLRGTVLEKAA